MQTKAALRLRRVAVEVKMDGGIWDGGICTAHRASIGKYGDVFG